MLAEVHPDDYDVINHMVENNTEKYNLRKAAEEFIELGLVLLQKTNKKDGYVDDQEVIDEIGDAIIRLEILLRMYPTEKIGSRIFDKIIKFRRFISEKSPSKF